MRRGFIGAALSALAAIPPATVRHHSPLGEWTRDVVASGRLSMKIVGLDTWTVSVPYVHDEISSRVVRGGVTDTVVRLTADNGLIGWGECTSGPDAASIEQAVRSARPLVIGRDPWQSEAIARDFFRTALWDLRAPSGNFAFAGIDPALRDLSGKECGQPLYRLFGGSLRDEVDYFYYLARGTPEEITRQAADGVSRDYTCYYLK